VLGVCKQLLGGVALSGDGQADNHLQLKQSVKLLAAGVD
jgi:hypothetical protein